jgi:transcriptional regulator GlxA family with amidase domain
MEFLKSSMSLDSESLSELTRLALEIIKNRYSEGINIFEVASTLGVSQEHLIRKFTQEVGATPGHSLTRIKIENAVRLLSQTDMSLDEVAKRVGYSNGNYLSKTFHQHTGISPSEFRRRRDQSDISKLMFY